MSEHPQPPEPAPQPSAAGSPAAVVSASGADRTGDAAWYFHCVRAAAAVLNPHGSAPRTIPDAPPEPPDTLTFSGVGTAARWLSAARTTLRWRVVAAQQEGRDTEAWTLALALHDVYAHNNWFADWIAVAGTGLDCARRAGSSRAEAMLLESLGKAHVQAGDRAEGLRHLRQAVGLWEELGAGHETLAPLNAVGVALLRGGYATRALGVFSRVLDRATGPHAQYWRAVALGNAAAALQTAGRPAESLELLPELLAEHRARHEPRREGNTLRLLSRAHRMLGDPERAHRAIAEALDIAEVLGNAVLHAFWSLEAGHVQADLGRHDEAHEIYQRCVDTHRELGDGEREALAVAGIARAHTACGRPENALPLHGHAVRALRTLDSRRHLAHALLDTADTLGLLAEHDRAHRALHEARGLLAGFDDPAADALRDHIDRTAPA